MNLDEAFSGSGCCSMSCGVAQKDETGDCQIIDSWDCYYYDDDDDDDDGATELVMSTGLAAIGLTFTGITIAAIANAVQEQCALGPTIVYEAGTTHPYYISPNLCTIGTKTFSSTRQCATPRRARSAASSMRPRPEPGKLALKHVQGLTCYRKRTESRRGRRPIAAPPSPADCRRPRCWASCRIVTRCVVVIFVGVELFLLEHGDEGRLGGRSGSRRTSATNCGQVSGPSALYTE